LTIEITFATSYWRSVVKLKNRLLDGMIPSLR
jgi:hypothetical protein